MFNILMATAGQKIERFFDNVWSGIKSVPIAVGNLLDNHRLDTIYDVGYVLGVLLFIIFFAYIFYWLGSRGA